MQNSDINYQQIFKDIISSKYPEKQEEYFPLLEKRNLSAIDILKINQKIFGTENKSDNQKHRSYTKSDILKILDFQKKHHLNNSELSKHFGISRNTITKWKRIFV